MSVKQTNACENFIINHYGKITGSLFLATSAAIVGGMVATVLIQVFVVGSAASLKTKMWTLIVSLTTTGIGAAGPMFIASLVNAAKKIATAKRATETD